MTDEKPNSATAEKAAPSGAIYRFGPGVCMREIFGMANTFFIEHTENFAHTSILVFGRVTILDSSGNTHEISGPRAYPTSPGQRILYYHENSVWLKIYATEERDIDELEKTLISREDPEVLKERAAPWYSQLQAGVDKADFQKVLAEFDVQEEALKAVFGAPDAMPSGLMSESIFVGHSHVGGAGLFASEPIALGETIVSQFTDPKIIQAMPFINHSKFPNAKLSVTASGLFELVSITPIPLTNQKEAEITIDYRKAIPQLMSTHSAGVH